MPIISQAIYQSVLPSNHGPAAFIGALQVPGAAVNLDDGNSFTGYHAAWRDDGPPTIWSYQVPINCEVVANDLTLAYAIGGQWDVKSGVTNESNIPRFTATVKIDGAAVFEHRYYGKSFWAPFTGVGGLFGTASIWPLGFGDPMYGDGLQLTSGQVLAIEIDPYDTGCLNGGFRPYVARATIIAIDTTTGLHVPIRGNLRPTDMATGQTLVSYTVPANGLTLRGFQIWADGGLPVVLARATLLYNDQPMAELGMLQGINWRTTQEPISIPLGGMTLGPRDKLALRGSPWADTGGSVSVVLTGTKRGIGYTRSSGW